MKKLSSILAAAVLAAAIGNVSAATDNPCPDLYTLRDTGSTFTHAFHGARSGKNADMWVLSSEPFLYGENAWQTIYVANMPGIDDPQTAVAKGQNDYNYSILMTAPDVAVFGTSIQCRYSPEGGNYQVVAMNEIMAGLKKFM